MPAKGSSESYRVVLKPHRGELRERGSRFLAVVSPTPDSAAAARLRAELASEHRDASHHCWAERIGWPPVERWSDAGEPRGTAGEPILRVLRARELSDISAVVVRWFGGVKLGKGGLARAYAGAVKKVLEAARFERRFQMICLDLKMPYERLGAVKQLARMHRADLERERFGAEVEATLRVRATAEEAMRSGLADLRVQVLSRAEDRS